MPTPHPVHLFPGVDVPVEQLSSNVVHHPDFVQRPDFDRAAPTPDHFIPLVCAAEVAGATPDVLVDGSTYGSLSMMCHTN